MDPLGGRLHPSKAAHPLSWARLPYPVSPSFTGCCYCFPKLLADRSEQCRRDIRSSNTGRVAVSAVSPPRHTGEPPPPEPDLAFIAGEADSRAWVGVFLLGPQPLYSEPLGETPPPGNAAWAPSAGPNSTLTLQPVCSWHAPDRGPCVC